jgi:hypothetical protein
MVYLIQNFCVWRWELEDMSHLSSSVREIMVQRRNDRIKVCGTTLNGWKGLIISQAQTFLVSLYQALSDTEKKAMLLKSRQKKQDASAGGKENVCLPSFASGLLIKSPSRFLKLLLFFQWLWIPLQLWDLQPQIQNRNQ